MTESEFKKRTFQYALGIIRLVDDLPRGPSVDVMARQLVKAGTSVGANYRTACRAKSAADMKSKLGIVEEESDESVFWLELLVASENLSLNTARPIIIEGNEILAMTVSSIKTLRSRG